MYLNHKYYIESPDAFQFELDLLEHLHQNNVPVAYPLPLSSGKTLGWTSTDLGERAFALFIFAEGEEVEAQNITLKQSFELGKTMAAFHLAANTFETKLERYRLDLKYLVEEPLRLLGEQGLERSKTISAQDRKIIREMIASLQPIEELVDSVKNFSADNDEFGIIHADLHVANVHF